MPRKRKLASLSNRCRFCLARDASMNEIFVDWIRPKLDDLEKCSNVEIQDKPNYPRNICYACLYKIDMWSEFKAQFLRTNKNLTSHIKLLEQRLQEGNKGTDTEESVPSENSDDAKRCKRDVSDIEKTVNSPISIEDDESIIIMDSSEQSSPFVQKKKERSKKLLREAHALRWEKRKSAMRAANGRLFSDSDSDAESELSPVQKARAKVNSELEKRLKIEKSLEYPKADLADKYSTKREDIFVNERQIRSQMESSANKTVRFIPHKSLQIERDNLKINEKTTNVQNIVLSENDQSITIVPPEEMNENEESVIADEVQIEKRVSEPIDEIHKVVENEPTAMQTDSLENVEKQSSVNTESNCNIVEEIQIPPETLFEKDNNVESVIEAANNMEDVQITDITNDNKAAPNTLENNNNLTSVTLSAPIAINNVLFMPQNSAENENNDDFSPQTVTAEVSLNDELYLYTSTLDLLNSDDETALESNTSQSFRIGTNESDIKKCLNIDIDGMDAEALQHVQVELAQFVNEEVANSVVKNKSTINIKPISGSDSYEALNHQLKTILEKLFRSNYVNKNFTPKIFSNHDSISPSFIEAAKTSPVFQPKVRVTRMNLEKLKSVYTINNLQILEKQEDIPGALSRTVGKRRPILPKKYEDFSLTFDQEVEKKLKTPKSRASSSIALKSTTSRFKTMPVENLNDSVIEISQSPVRLLPNEVTIEVVKEPITPSSIDSPGTATLATSTPKIPTLKPLPSLAIKSTMLLTSKSSANKHPVAKSTNSNNNSKSSKCHYRHVCGVCHIQLYSKEEAQAHVISHKREMPHAKELSVATKEPISTPLASKPSTSITLTSKPSTSRSNIGPKTKLMRCKRCQAIVEATRIKEHICNSVKYGCTLCVNKNFSTQYLLDDHIKNAHSRTHKHSRHLPTAKPATANTSIIILDSSSEPVLPEDNMEVLIENQQPKNSYTCFVCDQVFTDENEMKDHLQMHCEEESEKEDNIVFQCTFCDQKFKRERLLKAHMNEHLLTDEDEVIMTADQIKEKRPGRPKTSGSSSKEASSPVEDYEKKDDESEAYVCTICDEIFESTEELTEHVETHNGNTHVCVLCDKLFTSIRDLQKHVSTHDQL